MTRLCRSCGVKTIDSGRRICINCRINNELASRKKAADKRNARIAAERAAALQTQVTCSSCGSECSGASAKVFRGQAGTLCRSCLEQRQAVTREEYKNKVNLARREAHRKSRLDRLSNRLVVCDVVDKYGFPVAHGDLLEERIGQEPVVGVVNRYWNYFGLADSLDGEKKVVMTCAVHGADVQWIFECEAARDLIRRMKIVHGHPVRAIDGTEIHGVKWFHRIPCTRAELVGTQWEDRKEVCDG